MTHALYNEIEPFAADWLERLVAAGHIAPGRVERRSIADLTPADVAGPGQRHFFAGIGVWSYALRLAGVADGADIWTGSCPCQPFSGAGSRRGFDDERHLWPAWFALIRQCRPAVVFGEQVASPDGRTWLDALRADLEGVGYAVGAADLCAAGVGAPHIRQRLFFVAYADSREWRPERIGSRSPRGEEPTGGRRAGELAHYMRNRPQGSAPPRTASGSVVGSGDRATGQLGDAPRDGIARRSRSGEVHRAQATLETGLDGDHGAQHAGAARGLGHAGRDRDLQHDGELRRDEGQREVGATHGDHASITAGATRGFWADADWIPCVDGVSRPVEPGTFPLAHGAPARVGRLRGYGNAIVTEVAATFIEAALDAIGGLA